MWSVNPGSKPGHHISTVESRGYIDARHGLDFPSEKPRPTGEIKIHGNVSYTPSTARSLNQIYLSDYSRFLARFKYMMEIKEGYGSEYSEAVMYYLSHLAPRSLSFDTTGGIIFGKILPDI